MAALICPKEPAHRCLPCHKQWVGARTITKSPLYAKSVYARPKCPQLWEPNSSEGGFGPHIEFPSDVTESEFDCLNLFLVRPSNEALKRKGLDYSKDALPVLVWIHGGGYGFGASTDPMWGI